MGVIPSIKGVMMSCKCVKCGVPCGCGELYCNEHLIEACLWLEEALRKEFKEFEHIQRSGKSNQSRKAKQI